MTNNVEQPSMCVLTIFISSLAKCLFKSLANFLNWVMSFYYWGIRVLYIAWIQISGKYMIFKHCFPFCCLSFRFLDGINCSTSFKFWWSPVEVFLLSFIRSWIYTCVSSESFIVVAFTFRSMIHFQLIFIFVIYKVGIHLHSSVCSYPVVSAPIVKRLFISPVEWFLAPSVKIIWP